MKKTILFLLILPLFLFSCESLKADVCGTDSECYETFLQIDNNWQTYFDYYYNWKFYKIKVPKSKVEFIKLERQYIIWELSKDNPYYNTIRLNLYLYKFWLEWLIF
jgi:hypothetical protein